VEALPSALALVAAFGLAPAALRALAAGGFLRENYRRRPLPFPLGFLIVPCALIALVVCAPLQDLTDLDPLRAGTGTVLLYGLGVALLGLVDDVFSPESRGWRGHGRAVLSGAFSTGALKAAGSLGLALFVLAGRYDTAGRYLLAVAVLVLATNLFNLVDLRPGRSTKALVVLGVGLTIGTWDAGPLAALGLLAFPAVALGIYDLRERAMLGDTGSNLLGALGGLWIVLSLDTLGQLIALALIALATVYGEFRSLGALIERTPVLRQLDSFGRPTHA
jgi:UDP-GlcNAc:undecaprenyl-phosphate/decaprenyl-phosphate GlcNAc-1-phosphate transferase